MSTINLVFPYGREQTIHMFPDGREVLRERERERERER